MYWIKKDTLETMEMAYPDCSILRKILKPPFTHDRIIYRKTNKIPRMNLDGLHFEPNIAANP